MEELWSRLGSGTGLPRFDELEALPVGGWQVGAGEVLFPRPEPAKE
jgi:hypothetical protein